MSTEYFVHDESSDCVVDTDWTPQILLTLLRLSGLRSTSKRSLADEDRVGAAPVGLAQENAAESGTEARIEEVVEHRVDAAVGAAHPLGDGDDDAPDVGLGVADGPRGQLQPGEGDVEREPGQGEGRYHDGQHPHRPQFGLVEPARVVQLRRDGDDFAGDLAVPHSLADEGVAGHDDHQRYYVAQTEVGHYKVDLSLQGIVPLLRAHGLLVSGTHRMKTFRSLCRFINPVANYETEIAKTGDGDSNEVHIFLFLSFIFC